MECDLLFDFLDKSGTYFHLKNDKEVIKIVKRDTDYKIYKSINGEDGIYEFVYGSSAPTEVIKKFEEII